MRTFVHSRAFLAPILALVMLIAVGCADAGEPATAPTLTVVAISRDLSLDTHRISLALLIQGAEGPERIDNAADSVRIRYGPVGENTFREASAIQWHEWPLRGGAYDFEPRFDSTGTWEIRAGLNKNGVTYEGAAFVSVAERSSSVSIGEPAPRSDTKTASSDEELRQITSAAEPDPSLYAMSVATAVQSGRATVIAFSTPAFCQTATCGPQLDVISDLRHQFGDQVNFVHVEVWDNPREMLDTGNPNIGRIAPSVNEWGLITEPWTFLVDANGVVFDKFEAFTTNDQLTAAIQRMLSAG